MQGAINLKCSAGEGAERGRLRIDVTADGQRGGVTVLPWPVALWLGRALQRPEVWCPMIPAEARDLRMVVYGDERRTILVEVRGQKWFEIPSYVATKTEGGKDKIDNPARIIGEQIMIAAKAVEEQAEAARIASDQALLFASGSPQLLSHDRRIFDEAKKEAQFGHEIRKAGLVGASALNNKPLVPLPTAMQFAPGTPQHVIDLARIKAGSMSKAQRDAARKALDDEEKNAP